MKYLIVIFVFFLALSHVGCARIGSPTGGLKDSIAPVMVIATPANKTISFDSKKITISFDEFIKFQDLNSQLIISPPIEKKPIIKPESSVAKKIKIEFLEPLNPNTTYTINFGNSIIDNNEGNELGRFSYVFSTGKYLDSLEISGKITNPSNTSKEIENISVLAYKNANDTLVGHHTPNYLTNTLKSDEFSLENLSEANYKIIALEDKNNNYQYDKGFERVAFQNNTLDLKASDSIDDFVLFIEPKNNKILRPTQTAGHVLIFPFQGIDVPKISATGINKNDYLVTKPSKKDSLYFWFKEIPKDSIYLTVQQDTVLKKFSRKPRDLKIDSLIIKSNIKGNFHPNDSLFLSSNIPIQQINRDSIQLLEQDSIPINDFTIIKNDQKQKILINFRRKPNRIYSLILKELAFTDILDKPSGKQIVKIKTLDPEEYGEIVLDIMNSTNKNLIVEISKNNFIDKDILIINTSKKISFKHLLPGEYQVRVIKDLNKNNKFDNGNFELRIQPEPIYNFNKKIMLRANYEIIETIKIN